jgi:membrane dipeptidase
MLLVDAHLDLSMNAIDYDRDLSLDVHDLRRREAGMAGKFRGLGTVTLPELRKADVGVCVATVICRTGRPGNPLPGVCCQASAYGVAQGQLAYYRLLERQGAVRILETGAELLAHVNAWKADADNTPLGFIIGMEGADPIVSPEQVDLWWEDGLRIVGPAHYGVGVYSHGTASFGGLFPQGRDLLKAMDRAGMVLDLSHLAEDAFWEALSLFQGRVLASHNNCRALVPGDRQFSDDQIRAVADRDGVIGVALDAWMLYPRWIKGVTPPNVVTMEAVADQIAHICSVAGSARHTAVGSDLDGGYGIEQCPEDLDTIVDLQRIPELLSRRGLSPSDIQEIMHGNWLRLLGEALP